MWADGFLKCLQLLRCHWSKKYRKLQKIRKKVRGTNATKWLGAAGAPPIYSTLSSQLAAPLIHPHPRTHGFVYFHIFVFLYFCKYYLIYLIFSARCTIDTSTAPKIYGIRPNHHFSSLFSARLFSVWASVSLLAWFQPRDFVVLLCLLHYIRFSSKK